MGSADRVTRIDARMNAYRRLNFPTLMMARRSYCADARDPSHAWAPVVEFSDVYLNRFGKMGSLPPIGAITGPILGDGIIHSLDGALVASPITLKPRTDRHERTLPN